MSEETSIDHDWRDGVVEKIAEVPRPGAEAPLNWNTLEGAKLFILNPEETPKWTYSFWVVHDNGVEFPLYDAGGLPTELTSMVGGGKQHIELSEQFWHELHTCLFYGTMFPYENHQMEERFPDEIPEKMPKIERFLVEKIAWSILHQEPEDIHYEEAWVAFQSLYEPFPTGGS